MRPHLRPPVGSVSGRIQANPNNWALKGPDAEDHALYASPTIWDSRAAFEAWTNSEAFRAAHCSAGDNKPLKGRLVRDAPHMRPEIARETLANSAATVAYGETIAIRISARDASGLTSITPYWLYRDGCDWTSGKIAMRSPRTEPSQSSLAIELSSRDDQVYMLMPVPLFRFDNNPALFKFLFKIVACGVAAAPNRPIQTSPRLFVGAKVGRARREAQLSNLRAAARAAPPRAVNDRAQCTRRSERTRTRLWRESNQSLSAPGILPGKRVPRPETGAA
jgi:hypothetical protein